MNIKQTINDTKQILLDLLGRTGKMSRPTSLRLRIMVDFLIVIVGLSVCIFLLGNYVVRREVVDRIQTQVKNNLKAVRSVYYRQLETIQIGLDLVEQDGDLPRLKEKLDLDYLFVVENSERASAQSQVVQSAFEGNAVGATRLIGMKEMRRIGIAPERKAPIMIRETPLARPTDKIQLDKFMAIEYARPIYEGGVIQRVIYGGKVLNKNFTLVDTMRSLVFDDQFYLHKPVGTVTIFQDDVRIATNVLDDNGDRAIGTRVSEIVYNNVIEKGKMWIDRAFVVTDWYVTAYEPIYNIEGKRIGILYVGTLESLFKDQAARIWKLFTRIIIGAIFASIIFAVILTGAIIKPLEGVIDAAENVSQGDLDSRVKTDSVIKEFNTLGRAFNDMADKVQQRDESLKVSNEKYKNLNRSYLDMINFVTHEIKGMLSTVMMSAYSLKDGTLGKINEAQAKSLASITRNLDYFAATVKNFFNLSRIEKGEMTIERKPMDSCRAVVDAAVESFQKLAQDKSIIMEVEVEEPLAFEADPDLLQMAVNNLVGNAVKYSPAEGKIKILSRREDRKFIISVMNAGDPIPEAERGKLFRKFSRLNTEVTRSAKGTGLGLFITSEIVRKHGGSVRYVAHEKNNEFIITLPLT